MKSFLSMALICSLFIGSSLAIGCNHPRYMSVGNKCQEVTCTANDQCSHFAPQCTGKGNTLCRPTAKICGCSKESVSGFNDKSNNCNKQKNGISNCLKGKICTSAGYCIKDPICSSRAEKCGTNRSCCSDLYCHSRLKTPNATECYKAAFPGEKCAVANGIPCIQGSKCLATKKVCSKRLNEDCSDNENICLPGTYCQSRGVPKAGEKAKTECF